MSNTIFKIGDKVKIICADKESSTSSTQRMIGRTAKIIKFSGVEKIPYSIYFEEENITLNFMEKEIEHTVKVGEQLVFNFMYEEKG